MSTDSLDLLDFLDRFDADRANGLDLPLHHYLAQFPRIELALAREYVRLREAEDRKTPKAQGAPTPADSRQIGPFRLVREIGRGGQGAVHLAEDLRVGRQVALKVLGDGASISNLTARSRFRREAEAIARLDHPSLCSIYEADLDAEVPYIAMRLVAGETLKEQLQRARQERSPGAGPRLPAVADMPRLMRLMERVARALHAAHEAGIQHRDIKPGNIQIDGNGMPVILDFGLAHFDQEGRTHEITLTMPGQAFGTPAYMAPERFDGDRSRVDRRTDVYSLGATLYECLTLALPEAAGSTSGESTRRRPSVDPSKLNPAIPRELRVVVETAMAFEPGHRYATALALAEDLRRICEFEPILARPASLWLRTRRWCRRHRGALVVSALVAAGLVAVMLLVVADQIKTRAYAAQEDVQQVRTLSRTNPQLAVEIAVKAWGASPDDLVNTTALEALSRDHLAWESGQFESVAGDKGFLRCGVPDFAVADGIVATAVSSRAATVSEVATGEVRARLVGDTELTSLSATPIGGEIFAVWQDGSARCWQAESGNKAWTCGAPGLAERHLLTIAQPPGPPQRLLLVTRENDLILWDRQTGCEVFHVRHPDAEVDAEHVSVVFSSNGALMASGLGRPFDSRGVILPAKARPVVWNAQTGEEVWRPPFPGNRINWFGLSADGALLALTCEEGLVAVYDVEHKRKVFLRRYEAEIYQGGFHPNGRDLVIGLGSSRFAMDPALLAATVRVLDLASGEETALLSGHRMRGVMALAFSPDGTRFVSAGNDKSLVVRRTNRLAEEPECVLQSCFEFPLAVAWSHDQRHLLSLDQDGRLAAWDVEQPAIPTLMHEDKVTAVCFVGDDRVATGTDRGSLRVWSRTTGAVERDLASADAYVSRLQTTADGRWLAAHSRGLVASLFDTRSWDVVRVERPSRIAVFEISSAGTHAVIGDEDGGVTMLDLRTRSATEIGRHRSSVGCAAFAPDGKSVLTACGRDVSIWRVSDGTLACTYDLESTSTQNARDDNRHDMVACALPRDAWLIATQQLRVQILHDGMVEPSPVSRMIPQVSRFALHPDGTLLAMGHSVGLLKLVEWPAQTTLDFESAFGGPMTALEFGRTGRFLLSAGMDGEARLLRTDAAPRRWASMPGHAGPILAAALSPDERWAATASADHTVRIWPTEPIEFCKGRLTQGRNLRRVLQRSR